MKKEKTSVIFNKERIVAMTSKAVLFSINNDFKVWFPLKKAKNVYGNNELVSVEANKNFKTRIFKNDDSYKVIEEKIMSFDEFVKYTYMNDIDDLKKFI